MSSPPSHPKIFHIVHADRVASILGNGRLYSDAELQSRQMVGVGTTIGMSRIKARRLNELRLASHPHLFVGQCVPFYFCPRSVMLFLIHKRNAELTYQGGQEEIVHLQCDMHKAVEWAERNARCWAFTLSNAASRYFEDRCDIDHLDEVNWDAVRSNNWSAIKEAKQAEFLVERSFPWHLVDTIGVHSATLAHRIRHCMRDAQHMPSIEIRREWYY